MKSLLTCDFAIVVYICIFVTLGIVKLHEAWRCMRNRADGVRSMEKYKIRLARERDDYLWERVNKLEEQLKSK